MVQSSQSDKYEVELVHELVLRVRRTVGADATERIGAAVVEVEAHRKDCGLRHLVNECDDERRPGAQNQTRKIHG